MLRWLAGCGALGALVALVAGLAPIAPALSELAYPLAYLAVCAEIALAAALRARAEKAPALELSALALAVIALVGLDSAPATWRSTGLATSALLLAGSALGAQLGARIAELSHLTAVVGVSAVVDVWSVYDAAGPSARLAASVAREPDRLSGFVLSFPLIGSAYIVPLIGVGDVLFAALYATALVRHGVTEGRVRWALFAGLAVGLPITLLLARPVPLLPFLGAAVMLTDARVRSLSATDRRTVLVAVALLALAVGLRMAR